MIQKSLSRYNKFMKCPACSKTMKKIEQDASFNPKDDNKEYVRVMYHCATDDIWVTTEVPKSS